MCCACRNCDLIWGLIKGFDSFCRTNSLGVPSIDLCWMHAQGTDDSVAFQKSVADSRCKKSVLNLVSQRPMTTLQRPIRAPVNQGPPPHAYFLLVSFFLYYLFNKTISKPFITFKKFFPDSFCLSFYLNRLCLLQHLCWGVGKWNGRPGKKNLLNTCTGDCIGIQFLCPWRQYFFSFSKKIWWLH